MTRLGSYTPTLAPALALVAVLALAVAPLAQAQRPPQDAAVNDVAGGLPEKLNDVGFDQRLGEDVPLDLTFRDSDGETVRLADYFDRGHPVVLSLVYYECPMLCDLTLTGMAQSLRPLELTVGEDFEVVTVSFDPGEGPEVAAEAKNLYVPRYGRAPAWEGWHFLTGDEDQIRRLADAVGFRYVYEEETDEYAHAAGLVMITPEGEISRYFFGTEHPAKDLRLGLVETADDRIGTAIDQILLYCYNYDPALGRYSAATMNLIRAGGALTVLLLGGFIVVMLRRERREASHGADAAARTA